jgi:hypothetical protein
VFGLLQVLQQQIPIESFGVKRLALEVDYANTILFDGLRQCLIFNCVEQEKAFILRRPTS